MCDYFAWPVWEFPSRIGTAEEDLPLSQETKVALREWAKTYDRRLQTDDFSYDEVSHDEQGRELWRRVQTELGTGWRVGYFNERSLDIEWP
jgi:hypothetical protein